jgi:hypothetical protein
MVRIWGHYSCFDSFYAGKCSSCVERVCKGVLFAILWPDGNVLALMERLVTVITERMCLHSGYGSFPYVSRCRFKDAVHASHCDINAI